MRRKLGSNKEETERFLLSVPLLLLLPLPAAAPPPPAGGGGGAGAGAGARGVICRAGGDVDLALLDLAASLRRKVLDLPLRIHVEYDVSELVLQLGDLLVLLLLCTHTHTEEEEKKSRRRS